MTLSQNTKFMISTAWRVCRTVLFFVVLLAIITTAKAAMELLLAPVILKKVETQTPFWELAATISMFGASLLLLSGTEAYFRQNALFGRIAVRQDLLRQIGNKAAGTSYPNTLKADFLNFQEKSYKACYDNTSPGEAFWNTLTDLLTNGLSFLVWLVLLSGLNPLFMWVIGGTSVAGYLLGKSVNQWGWRHREEEAVCHKEMDYICRMSTGRVYAKDIRIFGLRSWLEQVWDRAFDRYQSFLKKRERIYIWMNLGELSLTVLRSGTTFFYLLTLFFEQGLSVADFLLYFTAAVSFTRWVTGILDQMSLLHRQSLELSVIREFLEWPEPFLFEQGRPLLEEMNQSYEICLDQVSFAYEGAERNTISHINLTISPGEKLAVVGLNGAGKTTLIKLICGFLDPTEGAVLLNGKDIRQYNRRDYYRLFSAIFQDFSILEASVAENVAQSIDAIDLKRVRECIRLSGLTQKVETLPDGLNTKLGRLVYEDGVELSGGQTQRVMLARALYKNAPVLVLDEPTAALDPIAEYDMYLKYSQMTHGRTSVFISHRLASTQFCDRILFLEQGRIVEEGSHKQLLDQKGHYARLFELQSRYYQEKGEEYGQE